MTYLLFGFAFCVTGVAIGYVIWGINPVIKCEHEFKLHENYCRLAQDSIYLQQFKCSKCGKIKNEYV